MPRQFGLLGSAPGALRGAFSRERALEWLRAFVLGLMCGPDRLGVSSAVRAPGLEPEAYGSLVGLFRSSARTADGLRRAWLSRQPQPMGRAGRIVLCSGGDVAFAGFSRTPKAKAASVRTMREWPRARVSAFVHGAADSPMAAFIRERQAGEGGYAPRAAGLPRRRRR